MLFDYGLLDKICDEIKYLVSKKSGITGSITYIFGNIKIDSYNSFVLKNINFHNVIISIKSVINKHNKFLENGS